MLGNLRKSTFGLPPSESGECHRHPPVLQMGQAGRDGSADPFAEQLHFCQPSSMLTQSNPSDAKFVAWPLTFRLSSSTAFIWDRITVSLMSALNRFHDRHPL
jgi:hypothetical protein